MILLPLATIVKANYETRDAAPSPAGGGQKYFKDFGGTSVKSSRVAQILDALNKQGSGARAAMVLQTTSVTLAKAIERHGIVQRWVAGDETEVGKRRRREHARDDGQEERVVS